jgi:anti-anti-sigma factor
MTDMKITALGNGVTKVELTGRLDVRGVADVELKLTARLVPIAARAVVDMSGVGFVGSMGVGMFISCAKALAKKNGKLVLFAAQPAVQQVLEVAGLNSITPIVAYIDAALAAALA